MNKSILLILLGGLLSLASHARPVAVDGVGSSGGGNAVLCKDANGNETARLLDYVEAEALRGMTPTLTGASVDAKVKSAFDRLAKVDAHRASMYQERANTFFQNAILVPNVDLQPIPDSNNIVLPANCTMKQLAIRKQPAHPGDKTFTISKDIWDKMPDDDRAGLLIHEILYADFAALGATDSSDARYLNAYISSSAFDQLTLKDFIAVLKSIKVLKTLYVRDLELALEPIEFYNDMQIKTAVVVGGYLDLGGHRSIPRAKQKLEFYDNGQPMSVLFDNNIPFDFGNGNKLTLSRTDYRANGIRFHPNGMVAAAYLPTGSSTTPPSYFTVYDGTIEIADYPHMLQFHPNGMLKVASIPKSTLPMSLTCSDGSITKIRPSTNPYGAEFAAIVNFDETGRVADCK